MNAQEPLCYYCNAPATTQEHVPPRSFFPKGAGLKLRTVPSCTVHNNDKSNDDQYLLAHICINAGRGDNLAARIFTRSIEPQLGRSKRFWENLVEGAERMPTGAVRYPVDLERFDRFFDHLARAIFFDKYRTPLDSASYRISHTYLSLDTSDPGELLRRRFLTSMLGMFFREASDFVAHYDAARVDEAVYQNKVIAPPGGKGSITIAHTFYGVFDVVSLLSEKRSW